MDVQQEDASKFHAALAASIPDGVYFVDLKRNILYWNQGAERISGYPAEEVTGHCCHENILVHVDDKGCQLCVDKCPLVHTLETGEMQEGSVYLHHKDGHRVPVAVRMAPVRNPAGEIVGGVEIFKDATEQLASLQRLEELKQQALRCPLTKVGNRAFVEQILQNTFDEFGHQGWAFGVIFVDVDHFKRFNDNYGHEMGDRVLKMVADTMSRALRCFDSIGRWGGEEFVVITPNVTAEALTSIAERLRALVETSFIQHGDQQLQVTISVGAALCASGDTQESLVARADSLMYQSKHSGRNRITVG